MNITIWIATGILVVAFLVGGPVKVFTSREAQKELGLNYVDDFTEKMIRLIGGLELAAVGGLLIPALTNTATFLVPLAAFGLALTMAGAIYTHYRRGEMGEIMKPFGLLVVATFVAIMRFGPENL